MKNQSISLREEALHKAQNQDNSLAIAALVKKDKKFVSRKIEDLKRELEDLSDDFQQRLSSVNPVDESLVEVHFQKIRNVEDKLKNYENFSDKFLS